MIGLLTAPAVLAGVAAFLWASTWLEARIAPLRYDPELRTLKKVDTAFTNTAARQAPPDTDSQLADQTT